MTGRPATISVVQRDVADVLAETRNVTVPLPVSLDPDTMLTQLEPSLAVQAQLDAAATLTVT